MAPTDSGGTAPMETDHGESSSSSNGKSSQNRQEWGQEHMAHTGERYLVLVEFVYRHLNFQMAELESILETFDIALGSEKCRLHPLPIPLEEGSLEIEAKNRAFVILSFPIADAQKWSGLALQTPEEQRKNIRFEPRIEIGASSSSAASKLSIADILYKCTLVKSVVELWGYSSSSLEECATRTLEWVQRKQNNIESASDRPSPLAPSFQKEHLWPSVFANPEQPWKFTIHTLGTKVHRDEQDKMRQTFRKTLDCIEGPVRLKDPTAQEFLLIREIQLDGKGSPLWAKTEKTTTTTGTETSQPNREFNTDAIAYYFGRVLGGRTRSSDGSRGIDHYSLKTRPYLGPTSMDAELSFVMTSLGRVTSSTIVYDPFVGTGSILLSCAMRGAYCIGSDIDIRVLRGKGGDRTIWKNFDYYGLPRPEILRTDNALYHRHFRHHTPGDSVEDEDESVVAPTLYDAILCDPPYGIRAGARQTGSRLENPRPILEENRHDHIAQTKPYVVSDVMSDLLDVAARTLVVGGRLVYVIPSFRDFDEERDLPRHDCLELVHTCYQPFSTELGRRIVAMEKVSDYDPRKRQTYLSTIWKFGAESAEKCANLREKIMEAARLKPGYEEKAKIRKEKRRANKEAKKQEKRAKRAADQRALEVQNQQ
ncbi:unnamed protein product [Pseudo-nitzschia multistriata]|uniref:tRNA (guanine(10)-N(2))-methyltransferase n=1 Tax=Pseudo-nitzschia multistriata TaxID=183589 RepID=A0A448ZQV7_9STRA|nr:unnamed protein product [Pseudo-nitzschia multistriata]